eukprot:Skav209516  [mRNA]  locus=scaffold2767:285060:286113:- [translate_table: standard]
MEALGDHDLFLGRMDKLRQQLNEWKSVQPNRSTSQSLANRSGRSQSSRGSLKGLGDGKIARSFVNLRQHTETPSSGSRFWNTSRGSQDAKTRVESPILKPSTRGSRPASRSPSKALVSILPYSAKDWLNDDEKESELAKATQNETTLKSETPEPSIKLVKNEWQRSRNKLIDGSPSRRRRVESKSPKRSHTSPSLSPSSRRSNRSVIFTENPFQMPEGSTEASLSETLKHPSLRSNEDSQDFESRIRALQQKAGALPSADTCTSKL